MVGHRSPGSIWREARASGAPEASAWALSAEGPGGRGRQGGLGGRAGLPGVGAQIGEGEVGVATVSAWTWLGAEVLEVVTGDNEP